MVPIAQSQMLLRTRTELPNGLTLATEEFREGWDLALSVDARRLEKSIVTLGWNLTRVTDGPLKSGVGDTSQEAIGNALKLALRHISVHSNAVEVEHIELTQYPWFFLARVRVLPYCIQQGAPLPVLEEAVAIPGLHRQRCPSIDPGILYPHYGSAMPKLKQMLISSQGSQNQPQ
jgi:hypothetical protein